MRDDLRTRAVLEVKGFLLLEAIAEKEKLQVSQTDVDQHMEKLAGEVQQPVEKIRQAFKRNDSLEALRGRLRQDKALAFLLAKANLT
jgi:trigger factor